MNRRKKKLKSILFLVVAVSVIGVVWVFYQLRQNRTAVRIPLPAQTATKAIMALSKIRQTATKDGTVQWVLEASEAELETATGKMVLKSPKVVFYLTDGTRVNLTGKEGTLYTRNNNIEVRGNVRVRNNRYTLVTEALAYNHKQRILNADTPVQIIGQEIELKAAMMHYDLKTNQTRFNGAVEGILFENPAI